MWRSIGQVDRAFVDRSRADRAELSRFSVDLGAIEPRGRAMFPPGRAMSARCAKIDLKSILGSILAHPPQLFCKNQVFAWRVCVSERPVTHTSHMKTSLFRKSIGRVGKNGAFGPTGLQKGPPICPYLPPIYPFLAVFLVHWKKDTKRAPKRRPKVT